MRPSTPLALVAGLTLLLAGCGAPPELTDNTDDPGAAPTPTSPTGLPTPGFPTGPPGAPPPTGFGTGAVAINCGGEPDEDEVLAVLRDDGMLGPDLPAEVVVGPLCAAGWQYAVVEVRDRDPLQVVTRGEPGGLTLVTAGTDICTAEVQIQAPPGIRNAASCVP